VNLAILYAWRFPYGRPSTEGTDACQAADSRKLGLVELRRGGIAADPALAAVRSDPRFAAPVARLDGESARQRQQLGF
jgi:hypothetical protein